MQVVGKVRRNSPGRRASHRRQWTRRDRGGGAPDNAAACPRQGLEMPFDLKRHHTHLHQDQQRRRGKDDRDQLARPAQHQPDPAAAMQGSHQVHLGRLQRSSHHPRRRHAWPARTTSRREPAAHPAPAETTITDSTTDPVLVAALHSWFDAQSSEHSMPGISGQQRGSRCAVAHHPGAATAAIVSTVAWQWSAPPAYRTRLGRHAPRAGIAIPRATTNSGVVASTISAAPMAWRRRRPIGAGGANSR
jgi:hypothetical protein